MEHPYTQCSEPAASGGLLVFAWSAIFLEFCSVLSLGTCFSVSSFGRLPVFVPITRQSCCVSLLGGWPVVAGAP